uniref:Uncharacterized protein n=1 Tax=Arundo donax TaxID=35708 RepID=A0A0A9FAJ1_ARUDO
MKKNIILVFFMLLKCATSK